MALPTYESLNVRLWANINGTIVDVITCNTTYQRNGIPTCTLALPIGYTALPPHLTSSAHLLAGVQFQIPILVYCTITYVSGLITPSTPIGTYLLFWGWVTGVGYRRSYNSYEMTIECTHWLSALNFSSAVSASSSVDNPGNFLLWASVGRGAGGQAGNWIDKTSLDIFFTEDNITEDMWGTAILPWFQALASEDRIFVEQFIDAGGNSGNDTTLGDVNTALTMFDGDMLPLDVAGATDVLVAQDICSFAGQLAHDVDAMISNVGSKTMWDLLMGLGNTFMFSVIPYPDRAKVVPFIPGLRSYWNPTGETYTISARDLVSADINALLPRPLRAFGYASVSSNMAGGNLEPSADPTICGMYVGGNQGMVTIRRAPAFVSKSGLPAIFSHQITNVRGNAFNHPGVGDAPAIDRANEEEKYSGILSNLARASYVTELLHNRSGSVAGPLRFDIAPGSTIKIEGTDGAFLGAGEDRYASVESVSYNLSSKDPTCYTTYRLQHIRTAAENQSAQFSIERHPLYYRVWTGDWHCRSS